MRLTRPTSGIGYCGDLTEPDEFLEHLEGWGISDVDLVAGGPPCQPFSRAGQSKLRQLVREGNRSFEEPRAQLWKSFVAVVERLRPRAVLVENVPDLPSWSEGAVLISLHESLRELGYSVAARQVEQSATLVAGSLVPHPPRRNYCVRYGAFGRWQDPNPRFNASRLRRKFDPAGGRFVINCWGERRRGGSKPDEAAFLGSAAESRQRSCCRAPRAGNPRCGRGTGGRRERLQGWRRAARSMSSLPLQRFGSVGRR